MAQYKVQIDRTAVRTRIILVEADTAALALDKALDSAGDYYFGDDRESGVEYTGEVLE